MTIQIIVILFFGVGLPMYAFLTGVYYIKKNKVSEDRINRVATQVIDHPDDTSSLAHRLFQAGVLDLEDGKEIIEACYRIEKKVGLNPIPEDCCLLRDDLKPFFAYISDNKIDLNNTPILEISQVYKDTMTRDEAS